MTLYHIGSQKDISVTEDVHTIASLLKLYLRELPEPIIPHCLFDNAVRTIKGIVSYEENLSTKGMLGPAIVERLSTLQRFTMY